MKSKHLLSLMLVILVTIPMSGWGQALFDIQSIKYEPSRFFPILSSSDIVGAPDSPIPLDAIKKIDDRCRSRAPARFSPHALDTYCTCAAAATLGTVTVGDLKELQKESNMWMATRSAPHWICSNESCVILPHRISKRPWDKPMGRSLSRSTLPPNTMKLGRYDYDSLILSFYLERVYTMIFSTQALQRKSVPETLSCMM